MNWRLCSSVSSRRAHPGPLWLAHQSLRVSWPGVEIPCTCCSLLANSNTLFRLQSNLMASVGSWKQNSYGKIAPCPVTGSVPRLHALVHHAKLRLIDGKRINEFLNFGMFNTLCIGLCTTLQTMTFSNLKQVTTT